MGNLTKNLGDISKKISPCVKVGEMTFLREKFIKFIDNKFKEWEDYCAENNILVLYSVKKEIKKFRDSLAETKEITEKTANLRLIFGHEVDLKELGERWFDEYL
ncbi:hypothetical protein AsFcp4_163 [Aeromonas phage AsFcp_4]|uniref:Uncharacterized protein n=1 Tax=Aeromonas phage PX29 TaxID=926067 RepID=E5DQR5_9CAUD|nr:hypothetical protein CL89_gp002 [Aeromonas phage PX29]ADQ52721.1 conserved hypothetical protein [Aeromonas phage PX29]QAX98585.1 hypothetical protein ASfcp2_252 [Aeromonas phage AsFcp_2]QAX99616.1 hypothetical protein AsFcp4_163 [Aeromonas phage AsFcp_4]